MSPAERRWSLAAAISSIAVFGIGIGVGAPLLSLMLEARGTDSWVNGLNAAVTFLGVIIGPLLTPRLVARFGFKRFLLVALPLSLVLFIVMKPLDSLAAWFVLRFLGGIAGSSIFTATEAWISLLAGDSGRGRVIGLYAAMLSAGFGCGPLLLGATGIMGWAPFIAVSIIEVAAMLPLLAVPEHSGFTHGESHPFGMMRKMPLVILTVAMFGLYEGTTLALMPVWGARSALSPETAAALISAIFFGSIVLQVPVGWLSDRAGRNIAMRLSAGAGLVGALVLPLLAGQSLPLLVVLFLWGGLVTSVYPIALSMLGDRFQGADLVNGNAAIVIAYGIGSFCGPILGGVAMDIWNPHGLMAVLAILFGALLLTTWRRGDRARPIPARPARTPR